jgi:hypothetical protein
MMRRSGELGLLLALLGVFLLGGAFAYGAPGPMSLPKAILPIAPASDSSAPASAAEESPHWVEFVAPDTGVCATCRLRHVSPHPCRRRARPDAA